LSRGFPTNTAAAFLLPHVAVLTFAKLEFASGTSYVHNGLGTYTWGGFDWLGVGDFGSVSRLEEGSDVSPYGITLTLSALDATLANIALTEDYFMRPVTIYIGALSAADVLHDDPIQIWAGAMDVMTVSVGNDGGDSITLVCESELAAFDRSSGLRYTTQAQQRFYSGDLFFEFLPMIEGAKIKWRDNKSDSIAGGPNYVSGHSFGV